MDIVRNSYGCFQPNVAICSIVFMILPLFNLVGCEFFSFLAQKEVYSSRKEGFRTVFGVFLNYTFLQVARVTQVEQNNFACWCFAWSHRMEYEIPAVEWKLQIQKTQIRKKCDELVTCIMCSSFFFLRYFQFSQTSGLGHKENLNACDWNPFQSTKNAKEKLGLQLSEATSSW